MKKSDKTCVLSAVFVSATAFFYCCNWWLSPRLPRYYPLERTWKWVKEAGVPSQGWYGMQVFAFLLAGIATLVVYIVLRRTKLAEKELTGGQTMRIGLAMTAVTVLGLAYILHYEFSHWGIL